MKIQLLSVLYLLIDMPPGTGDVALTVFQIIPVDEIIIVTSPQDLVTLVVKKALKMAELMNINVLGVIENMSYVVCPDCQKHIQIFGQSKLEQFAKEANFKILARLPIITENTLLIDNGRADDISLDEISSVIDLL